MTSWLVVTPPLHKMVIVAWRGTVRARVISWMMVRRPVGRLGGRSGTLCVNDGPATGRQLARVIYASRGTDVLMERAESKLEAALALLAAVEVPSEPCEYPRCNGSGPRMTHGAWCPRHAAKMEWRPGEQAKQQGG